MSAPPFDVPDGVLTVRRSLCLKCPTPCAQQHNAEHYGRACAKCPLPAPRWGQRGRCRGDEPRTPYAPPVSTPTPTEPTLVELATNFAGAVARWAEGGFATVPADVYAARSAACDACEHWDASARLGLGKCRAPGCGCTSLKRWLATEKCPLGRWPAL